MHIGIDLGGTKIAGGLVHNGRIIKRMRVPTEAGKGKAHVLSQLRSVVEELSSGRRIEGVGIGVPGMHVGTKLTKITNIPSLNGVDLKKELGYRNLAVENDAKCFALAEYRHRRKDLVGLVIGTGVGAGVIIGGKLFRGHSGHAGEVGHMVMPDTESYRVGQRDGAWEGLLCGPSILARYKARGGTAERPSALWELDEPAAVETRRETTRYLAAFAANLIRAYDPAVIVLGGGVSNRLLVKEANRLLPEYGVKPILVLSSLKEDAGILGAAYSVK